jgi:hypothetical protein
LDGSDSCNNSANHGDAAEDNGACPIPLFPSAMLTFLGIPMVHVGVMRKEIWPPVGGIFILIFGIARIFLNLVWPSPSP